MAASKMSKMAKYVKTKKIIENERNNNGAKMKMKRHQWRNGVIEPVKKGMAARHGMSMAKKSWHNGIKRHVEEMA
jgi:hypothetical protein